jgi:hypothetical protein
MAVQITLSDLRHKVQEGWKKVALAEHYGLPVSQMTQILKDAQLTIRKFHAPKYELIDDTENVSESVMEDEPVSIQDLEVNSYTEVIEESQVNTVVEELVDTTENGVYEEVPTLEEVQETSTW